MFRYAVLVLTAGSLFGQIDPSIPLRVQQPTSPNLIQQIMEVQRIRNLQMQERIQAEELRRRQIQNDARATQSAPQAKPAEVKPPDTAPTETNGLYNGRFWKQLAAGEKIMFVVGFTNGIGITNVPNAEAYVPAKLTNNEIVGGLDRFYLEPENLLIPLSLSVVILSQKASGAEPALIDSLIAEVRRWSVRPLNQQGR